MSSSNHTIGFEAQFIGDVILQGITTVVVIILIIQLIRLVLLAIKALKLYIQKNS